MYAHINCRAVAESGACTAEQDDVLYNVLMLVSMGRMRSSVYTYLMLFQVVFKIVKVVFF